MIVYSQTGNTLAVAQKLQDKLSAAGHGVTLEQIEIAGQHMPGQAVQFEAVPDPAPYDALVLAAPVQAFSLIEVMESYLEQVSSLEGKAVACLTTEALPFPWLGGKRAIDQMTALAEAKGATVRGGGIVNWSRWRRERQIKEVTDSLCGLF